MKLGRLFVVAFLFSIGVPLAIAQEPIRLQLEVVKDGSTVARPEISVISGSAGTIEVEGVGTVAVTPTVRGSDAVAVLFDILSGGKHLQPRLVIGKNEPGILSWTADTRESFKLTVSWVR